MTTPHLFVYGSLLSGFRSPAYEYVSRYFELVGPAKVKGRLYDMGEYPAAIPTEDDVYIKGELYSIRNMAELSWAIGQLDDYEGVVPEPGEVQLYRREPVAVYHNDDKIVAWIYWYNGETTGRPVIGSGDVIDYQKNK